MATGGADIANTVKEGVQDMDMGQENMKEGDYDIQTIHGNEPEAGSKVSTEIKTYRHL